MDNVSCVYFKVSLSLSLPAQPKEKKMRLETEFMSRQSKRERRPKKLYKMAPGEDREGKKKG